MDLLESVKYMVKRHASICRRISESTPVPLPQYIYNYWKRFDANRSCKSYHEIPEVYREPGILSGYRNENSSFMEACFSLLRINNETINFWTHFISGLYFVYLLMHLSQRMPFFTDVYMYPFVCYIVATCLYPFASSFAHAFCCLSVNAFYICFFMDYFSLAFYSWGVAMLYYAFIFPPYMLNTLYSQAFLPVAFLITLFTTTMTCFSQFMKKSQLSVFCRLGAFIIPFVWDSAPLVWRIWSCDPELDTCQDSNVHYVRKFVLVSIAVFFYASHLPERLMPGSFDFAFGSHNLFHLGGVLATNEQLKGSLIDLTQRREALEAIGWVAWPAWTLVFTPLLLLGNSLIVYAFSRAMINKNIGRKKKV